MRSVPLAAHPLARYVLVFLAVFAALSLLTTRLDVIRTDKAQEPYLDLEGYLAASQNIKLGNDPYLQPESGYRTVYRPKVWQKMGIEEAHQVYPYIYPPLLAELLRPFPARLERTAARFNFLIVLSILSLGLLAWRAWDRQPLLAWALLTYLLTAAAGKPVADCFLYGQVNTFLAGFMGWSLYLTRMPQRLWQGVGYVLAGLAFWLKLIPIAFLGLEALSRPKRIWALAGLAGGVLLVGLALTALHPWVMQDWMAFALRGGNAFETPVYGLASLSGDLPWAVPVLRIGTGVLAGVGIWLGMSRGGEDGAYLAMLPLSVALFLLAPVSWLHHLAFYLLPAVLGLLAYCRLQPGRAALWLTVLTAIFLTGPKIRTPLPFLANLVLYRFTTWAGLAVLVLTVVLLAKLPVGAAGRQPKA